jgi:hypothetical protein
MSKQVLDISQMQHLEELGVDTSNANFYWHRTISLNNYNDWDEWKLHYGVLRLARGFTTINCQYVRTFTLQDILDLLPNLIESQDEGNNYWLEFGTAMEDEEWWYIRYMSVYGVKLNYEEDEHLIDAAYEMLCWCIENEYVRTESN